MKVKFWGCRGSLPASYPGSNIQEKVKEILKKAAYSDISSDENIDQFISQLPFHLISSYGTNTSCVQIIGGDEIIICDAGSGIRDLGRQLLSQMPNMPKVINLFLSHLHWDHIHGFPFFVPAYLQGVTIHIWGCHNNIKDTFIQQQENPTFPVSMNDMGSNIIFHTLDVAESLNIGGINISMIKQPHPGDSYGYRFELNDKVIVYSTDAEHDKESEDENYPFLKFIKKANLLIFDGQFSLADHLFTKQYWGHSSNLVGIELATRADVKKLCLFHSEHTFNDNELNDFLVKSQRYSKIYDDQSELEISIAYDGLEFDL